jgi:hypothetical protein
MDRLHLSQHISRRFGSAIEDLRREVLAMGGLVEEQVDAARSALVARSRSPNTSFIAASAPTRLWLTLTYAAPGTRRTTAAADERLTWRCLG